MSVVFSSLFFVVLLT